MEAIGYCRDVHYNENTYLSPPGRRRRAEHHEGTRNIWFVYNLVILFILVISILHFLCTIFFIINKLFKTNVRCKRGKTQVHKPIVRKKKLFRRTRRPLRSRFEMVNTQVESTDESDNNDIFDVLHSV